MRRIGTSRASAFSAAEVFARSSFASSLRDLPKCDHACGRLVFREPFERGSRLEQRGRERDHPGAALRHRRRAAQRDGGAKAVASEAHGALEAPQRVDRAEHGGHVIRQRVEKALRRGGVPEAEQVDDGDVVGAGEHLGSGKPALGGVLEAVEQHERLAAPAAPGDVELADLVAHDLLGDPLGHVPERHVVGGQAVDGADLHVGLEALERGRLADLDDRVPHADRVNDRHGELGEVVDPRGRVDGVREVLAHDLPVRGEVLGVEGVFERRFADPGRELVEDAVLLLRAREPLPQPPRHGLVEHLEAVALGLDELGRAGRTGRRAGRAGEAGGDRSTRSAARCRRRASSRPAGRGRRRPGRCSVFSMTSACSSAE